MHDHEEAFSNLYGRVRNFKETFVVKFDAFKSKTICYTYIKNKSHSVLWLVAPSGRPEFFGSNLPGP